MELTIGLSLFVLVGGVYVIAVYNSFQRTKARIQAAIQQIGNHLKRQASLIPSLQESVKGYLKHEKDIYAGITVARKAVEHAEKSGSLDDSEKAAKQISQMIPKLQVLVESNPELKADTTIRQFMEELRDTADKLLFSRQTLIDLTLDYNQKLVVFPTNVIAQVFGFKPEKGLSVPVTGDHLEVFADETQDIKVKF